MSNEITKDAFKAGFIAACHWPAPCTQDVDSPAFTHEYIMWSTAAEREQSPAVVTDEMVEVACLTFFVDASWKEYETCHSRVRPSVESDMRAALEAIVPLLQSPAV